MSGRKRLCCMTIVGLMFTSFTPSASAALAPGTVKRMKREASDVVRVEVSRVEQVRERITKLALTIHAKVTGVKRSASGLEMGDSITIHSYHLTGVILPPGPRNPPLIKKGWQGTIWLKATDNDGEYRIAVYGHSFEPKEE